MDALKHSFGSSQVGPDFINDNLARNTVVPMAFLKKRRAAICDE